ncbi:hypothetical protein [Bacteroides sp.]
MTISWGWTFEMTQPTVPNDAGERPEPRTSVPPSTHLVGIEVRGSER